jgi:predicted nucleic acid-binding protein
VKYLVDADVLSEATRVSPSPAVIDWLTRHEAELAVDPIILGELELGILRLASGRKRAALEQWFTATLGRVECLPFTGSTGRRWAQLVAGLQRRGVAMPIKDSLIAATALTHGLTVVTRNTRDFKLAGVALVDPFSSRGG